MIVVDLFPEFIQSGTNSTLSFTYTAPISAYQSAVSPQGLGRSAPYDFFDNTIVPSCGAAGGACVPSCWPQCLANYTQVMLTTANMKLGARRMLPSFDEPRYKVWLSAGHIVMM